ESRRRAAGRSQGVLRAPRQLQGRQEPGRVYEGVRGVDPRPGVTRPQVSGRTGAEPGVEPTGRRISILVALGRTSPTPTGRRISILVAPGRTSPTVPHPGP